MGGESVMGRVNPGSWKLAAGVAERAQGLVVSGFASLGAAQALFLRQTGRGGAWLSVLDGVAPVSDATGRQARAVALAFSYTGLRQLGLDPATELATFAEPFQQGMHQADRSRRLGDDDVRTLAPGGMQWSGNAHEEPRTAQEVHALLLLYAADTAAVAAWAEEVLGALTPAGVVLERRLALDLQKDERGLAREHFGFADGVSQPAPFGDGVVDRQGRPAARDPWHGVASGDILLGRANAHHEAAPGPYVAAGAAATTAGLVAGSAPDGAADLGLDGSYMVVRELQQDVAAFWGALDAGAAAIRGRDAGAGHVTAEWLAARIVGRDMDGNLLCPAGVMAAGADGMPGNAGGFLEADPQGFGCPAGSHVRRANPRDGLAASAADAQTLLDAANNHRILRRGRKYGPRAPGLREDDGQERGLLFMCLNTDLARQFEFVQQTWLLNPNFATLYDETDPLVGPKGPFTVREKGLALRRIVDVDTFVKLAGGDYFFLPSLPAIRYLAGIGRVEAEAASA